MNSPDMLEKKVAETLDAAGPWTKIEKRAPEEGPCLILADYGVGPVADVAYYNGRHPDGSHWWTMGDINIPAAAVKLWAPINIPEDMW